MQAYISLPDVGKKGREERLGRRRNVNNIYVGRIEDNKRVAKNRTKRLR